MKPQKKPLPPYPAPGCTPMKPCPVPDHHPGPHGSDGRPLCGCFTPPHRPFGPHGPAIPAGPFVCRDKEGKIKVDVNLFETPGAVTVIKNYYTEKTEDEAGNEDGDRPEIEQETIPIEWMLHRKTGKKFFPRTNTNAVTDNDGTTVQTHLESIYDRIAPALIKVQCTYNDKGEPVLDVLDDLTQGWIDSVDKGIRFIREDDGTDMVIFLDRYTWDPETENYNWFFEADGYIVKVDMAAHAAYYYEKGGGTGSGEGGGDGKVKDVLVNNTSVLGLDGIARIDLKSILDRVAALEAEIRDLKAKALMKA